MVWVTSPALCPTVLWTVPVSETSLHNQPLTSHASAPAQQEELKASRKSSREFTETPAPTSPCVNSWTTLAAAPGTASTSTAKRHPHQTHSSHFSFQPLPKSQTTTEMIFLSIPNPTRAWLWFERYQWMCNSWCEMAALVLPSPASHLPLPQLWAGGTSQLGDFWTTTPD